MAFLLPASKSAPLRDFVMEETVKVVPLSVLGVADPLPMKGVEVPEACSSTPWPFLIQDQPYETIRNVRKLHSTAHLHKFIDMAVSIVHELVIRAMVQDNPPANI